MGMSQGTVAAVLSLLLIGLLLRIFAKPLGLTLKLLLNTLAGFFALFLFHMLEPLTGIHLGLNLFNASVLGVLGFPGFVLLLLLKWVLLV
ncbi:MAG: pro-sigmaK processing inhibitor BofA family protein [Oscillospiraceae bacterium]|nr:pro-sigmaK processing inhibitor BofA family protein [Oscillospiraceae bacterium]